MASDRSTSSVYVPAIISRTVHLDIASTGADVSAVLGERVAGEIEGRCIVEGFVRPGSVEIHSFSAGVLEADRVVFEVAVSCDVCSPVEGERIECVARNVTKAGVRADVASDPSPVMIFLARDHHHRSKAFSEVEVGDVLNVQVIGQRFELNDPYVSVIASLEPAAHKRALPRIAIGEEVGEVG